MQQTFAKPQKAVAADLVMPSKLLNIWRRPVIAWPPEPNYTPLSHAQCGRTFSQRIQPPWPKRFKAILATDDRLLASTMVASSRKTSKPKVLGKAMQLFQSLITKSVLNFLQLGPPLVKLAISNYPAKRPHEHAPHPSRQAGRRPERLASAWRS